MFSVLLMTMVVLLLLILISGGDCRVHADNVEWIVLAVFVLKILIGDGNDAVDIPWVMVQLSGGVNPIGAILDLMEQGWQC
ncbi:hypothetical protein [Paenibacillus sp. FSL H7-0323]|uniref:hypothetical protein n=1 Tax=Paenibacillus sp. FSL H7-0323 TaxID=2921433 RepID=UPI0030F87527